MLLPLTLSALFPLCPQESRVREAVTNFKFMYNTVQGKDIKKKVG
jgi:hypothetical protein